MRLYAIADPGGPPLPDGLRAVPGGGLCAIVADERPPEPTTDALWEQEALLEELMRERDLLPLRFGETADDDAGLREMLERRGEELRRSLDRVRGCLEVAVHGDVATLKSLGPLARERRLDGPGRASYLVERGRLDTFTAAVDRAGAAWTGPWPPYSFGEASVLARRIDTDPETVEQGLVALVLTIVELLRQLMERQALRRVERDELDPEQVEKLGRTFMLLERRMTELREHFGLTPEDLNLDLGPLGRLL
jgi:hypothetical protein